MRSKSHAPATISVSDSTRARPRLQQEKRFHINPAAPHNLSFFLQWIRRDPHAVLQIAKAFSTEIASQSFPLRVLSSRHVEKNHSPLPVPIPPPALLRVASTQDMQPPRRRQSRAGHSANCCLAPGIVASPKWRL